MSVRALWFACVAVAVVCQLPRRPLAAPEEGENWWTAGRTAKHACCAQKLPKFESSKLLFHAQSGRPWLT